LRRGHGEPDPLLLVPDGHRDEPVPAPVDPDGGKEGSTFPARARSFPATPAYGQVQSSVRIIASAWERSIICPSPVVRRAARAARIDVADRSAAV